MRSLSLLSATAVPCNSPLTAVFFFFFIPPQAQNVSRSTSQQDRKSLSRLCCLSLSWHSDVLSMQEEVTGSERGVTGKAERCSEPRGYTNTANMRDLSINQAVTTRRPSN